MRVSNLIAVIFAGVLCAGSMVHANETVLADDAGQAAVSSTTDADDRMVCTYEKQIGSNMKTRICKTVAQRNREREEARNAMSRRQTCGNCTGN